MSKHLEKATLRRFHYILLIVLGLGWAFDATCAGLISTTTPLIRSEWNLSAAQMGVLLSCWLIGMLLGGITIGYLADKIGRKGAAIIALLLYSIPTALASLSQTPSQLGLLRLIAGIGSSGYMVVASTLLSEYIPARYRGRFVAFLESTWAFGWLLAVYLGRVIAPTYGWRQVFTTAALALIALPPMAYFVPESLRYLWEKGREDEINKVITRFGLTIADVEIAGRREEVRKIGIEELFSRRYRKRTAMLWIHWFCIVLAYWGIFLWLPNILYERGLSLVKTLNYTILITLAQIPGYWSGAILIDKIGRKPILTLYMALAGVGSILFAMAKSDVEVLIWGGMISFFNLGAWGATYAYTPELYPTRIRGTGAGTANSIGRIGGIIGPYLVGALLDITKGNVYPIFLTFMIVHLISAIAIATLGIETKGKTLEEISE